MRPLAEHRKQRLDGSAGLGIGDRQIQPPGERLPLAPAQLGARRLACSATSATARLAARLAAHCSQRRHGQCLRRCLRRGRGLAGLAGAQRVLADLLSLD